MPARDLDEQLKTIQPSDWRWTHRLFVFGLLLPLSVGTRLLTAQDASFEAPRVQATVVANYKRAGQLYNQNFGSFLSPKSPLNSPDLLSHPPGYSLLWALTLKLGGSDRSIQLLQIAFDFASALILFLIVSHFLTQAVAFLAAILAALAPQFSWNSVILLPDTITVLPILLSVYFLIIAFKRRALWAAIVAGLFMGLSCWLRPNALLLAPFSSLFILIFFPKGHRPMLAAGVICGAILVVAPLTIRNALVFRHFVPVSLGAGQTMLEGIGDYDSQKRFGVPNTDIEIMRQEAQAAGRPEYAERLFGEDGIARDRRRLVRALTVIKEHPFWFMSVMARRAGSMLRLERTPIIKAKSTSQMAVEASSPAQTISPEELVSRGSLMSTGARVSLMAEGEAANLFGDNSNYDPQFVYSLTGLEPNSEYVLHVPIRMRQGRVMLQISSGSAHFSTHADAVQGFSPEEQPEELIRISFVTGGEGAVSFHLKNLGSDLAPQAEIGRLKLFRAGKQRQTWGTYVRPAVHFIQRLFITAVIWPLSLLGLFILVRVRMWGAIAFFSLVPVYYLTFQSALHTEYRYVLTLHYFLFVFTATGIWFIGKTIRRFVKARMPGKS